MKNPIKEMIREANRDKEIIRVFYKYGFGAFLRQISGNSVVKNALLKNEKIEQYTSLPRGVRLRKALEELGPTFIKLGQILSTREDLIPPDMIEELKKLQDDVKEFSIKDAKRIFHEETGFELLEEFKKFDIEPLAAASIGQVYRAKIGDNNVIVKIQRPDIEETLRMDLKIMERVSKLIDNTFNKNGIMSFEKVIKEFSYYLNRELDYTYEAQNAHVFYQNFSSDETVMIPQIHWNYVTRRVLVMDEIIGIKIDNIKKLDKLGYNKEKLASILASSFMKQILIDGAFHGDPHPGNIMVIDQNKIGFIDFGIVGYLDDQTKRFISTIVKSIRNKNTDKIAEALVDINKDVEDIDEDSLKKDIYSVMSTYIDVPFDRVDLAQMMTDMMDVSNDYKLSIPPQLTLLVKSIVIIQGTINTLKPDFSVFDMVSGFIEQMYKGNFNIKKAAFELSDLFLDGYRNVLKAPRKYWKIIDHLARNRVRVFSMVDLSEKSRNSIEFTGRTVAFAIIISAMMITSGYLLATEHITKNRMVSTVLILSLISNFVVANVFVIRYIFRKK